MLRNDVGVELNPEPNPSHSLHYGTAIERIRSSSNLTCMPLFTKYTAVLPSLTNFKIWRRWEKANHFICRWRVGGKKDSRRFNSYYEFTTQKNLFKTNPPSFALLIRHKWVNKFLRTKTHMYYLCPISQKLLHFWPFNFKQTTKLYYYLHKVLRPGPRLNHTFPYPYTSQVIIHSYPISATCSIPSVRSVLRNN